MQGAATDRSNDMSSLFGGIYAGRRVLVTGHTGFKGSWLVLWLESMGAHVSGLSVGDAAHPNHFRLLGLSVEEKLVDVRDAGAVRAAIGELAPEIVFHLAGQSLVKRGYADPGLTFDVNVMGLINVLEAVRATPSVRAIVGVTGDNCYRQGAGDAPFREGDPLGGHDPYSASKACAEIVAASYRASYFCGERPTERWVALATGLAGNVLGGGDWSADRLVPDLARAASTRTMVAIRNPYAIRPWQHVLEPLSGYLMLGAQLLQPDTARRFSEAWNFGPAPEGHLTVSEVVAGLASHWSAVRAALDTDAHPPEAETLRLDSGKARTLLGWRPVWNAETMLERTANWYCAWYESGTLNTRVDLADYVRDATAAGLPWATMA